MSIFLKAYADAIDPRPEPEVYAWTIDTDHVADPGAPAGTYDNAVGVTGPSTAPADLLTLLAGVSGERFRIYDDDGELYYEGRIAFAGGATHDTADETAAFGPLWDFGRGNAGATEIRYCENGKWVTL